MDKIGTIIETRRKITLSLTRLPFDRRLDFERRAIPVSRIRRRDKKENVCSRKRFSRILSFLYCLPVIRTRPSGSNFPVSGIPKNRATRLIPPRFVDDLPAFPSFRRKDRLIRLSVNEAIVNLAVRCFRRN